MTFKDGDIVRPHAKPNFRFEILLIRGKWVWVKDTSTPADAIPSVISLSMLNDYYSRVPPFEKGDIVEHHCQHSGITIPGKGEVLALHEDRVWVKFENHAVPLSPLITSLKKMDK